jgi:hypothetical protein
MCLRVSDVSHVSHALGGAVLRRRFDAPRKLRNEPGAPHPVEQAAEIRVDDAGLTV